MEVQLISPAMLRGITEERFRERLVGKIVTDVKRRGKYIFFFLHEGSFLEVHLRMTGRFVYLPGDAGAGRHTRAVFFLQGGESLHFEDMRKFGTFRLWHKGEEANAASLQRGVDPLEERFDRDVFDKILKKRPRCRIKSLLLDQESIAGMGNIYTDEALFRAGIYPGKKAGSLEKEEKERLFQCICTVLQEGISKRGVSFSDYRDLWGGEGEYQDCLRVYRRRDKPCLLCGASISRTVVAGRGTYYCPECQKA